MKTKIILIIVFCLMGISQAFAQCATISGPTSVCVGSSVTYTASPSSGGWQIDESNATINSVTGELYAISPGTVTIRYSPYLPCIVTYTVTIEATPSAGTISGPSSVCTGSTIPLTTSGDAGGTWSSGTTGVATVDGSGTVTPVSSGASIISYSVTNSCGTFFSTHPVAVNLTPTVSPTASSYSICAGTTLSLYGGSSGATYVWSGPNSFASTNLNPSISSVTTLAAGIYTFTATIGSCTATATTPSVTVNPTPSVSPSAASYTLCAGSTIALSGGGSGGTTYAWSGPNSFTSTDLNPSISSATTAASGVYTFTATTGSCTATATTPSVTVNPTPTVLPSAASYTICAGTTLSLLDGGSGGTTYAWSGPNTFSSTLHTPSISSVTTAASGVYTLTATTGSCTATATTASVTVNTTPTSVTAGASPNPVCTNAPLTLSGTATGATSYSWAGPGSYSSSLLNPAIFTYIPIYLGTFTLTATNACGNTTATVAVTQLSQPSVTITPTASVVYACSGSSITLTASGTSVSYVWAPTTVDCSTCASVSATPIASLTTYSVTGTGSNGCSRTVTRAVKWPKIQDGTSICDQNGTATVSSIVDPGGTWSVDGSGYITAGSSTTSMGITSCIITSSSSCVSTTQHPVAYYTTLEGCVLSNTMNLLSAPYPTLSVSRSSICPADTLTTLIGTSGSTCGSATSGTHTYTWTGTTSGVSTTSFSGTTHVWTVGEPSTVSVSNTYGSGASSCPRSSNVVSISYCGTSPRESNNSNTANAAEQLDENLRVYPNPNSGTFTIELPGNDNATISIIDVSGRTILEQQTTEVKTQIDMSHSPAGIYFFRVINGTDQYRGKITLE